MKAVLNACYGLGLHKETQGMHHISMDNRYMAPQLAVILRERFHCFSTGTVCSNRLGWDKSLMNLSKTKDNRGTFKLIHDSVNGILCGQWIDSKVVSFVSSLEDTGHGVVKRQVGSRKKELNCPNPLIVYQQNMGSVDKGDQMRIQGGSFGTKGHFKKWYEKIYLAVVDCMLLNSYIAWNLSCHEQTVRGRRKRLSRHGFYTIIAQCLLQYEGTSDDMEQSTASIPDNPQCVDGHVLVEMTGRARCVVCMVEYRWMKGKLPMGGDVYECWQMRQMWPCCPFGSFQRQSDQGLENA